MTAKKTYEIDGDEFATLEEFFDVISRVLVPGTSWGRNLNACNDILRGGFGTPEEGFAILWRNSAQSRRNLGYQETARILQQELASCHPTNQNSIRDELAAAEKGFGPTVFDSLVEIIQTHCEGGSESEDGVELILQ